MRVSPAHEERERAPQMRGLSVSLRTRETTRGAGVAGSNQGDPGRRPTKAERREEARLKREEIQRSMARRRRNRTLGLGLVVVALVIAVVAVFLTSGGGDANATGIPSAETVLSQASAAKDSAGCDAVQETPNYADAPGADPAIDHEHIGSAADLHIAAEAVDVPDDAARVRPPRPDAAPGRDLRFAAGHLPDDPLARARRGDHLVRAGHDREGAGRPEGLLRATHVGCGRGPGEDHHRPVRLSRPG